MPIRLSDVERWGNGHKRMLGTRSLLRNAQEIVQIIAFQGVIARKNA
jgi:hypothetical protein